MWTPIVPSGLDDLSGIEQHELTRIYQEHNDDLIALQRQYNRDENDLAEKALRRVEAYLKEHGRDPDTASILLIEIGRRETQRKSAGE